MIKGLSVAKRYAKVLFDLESSEGVLEERLKELEMVNKILKENPMLAKLLRAPQILIKEKRKVFHDLFKDSLDETFIEYLLFLIDKERLSFLERIATEFKLMVHDYLGVWEAEIVTAVPIDSASESQLKQKLEQEFQKKIHLNKRVDPKIIGGIILIVSNEMMDWSVSGKIRKLKENLISTEV